MGSNLCRTLQGQYGPFRRERWWLFFQAISLCASAGYATSYGPPADQNGHLFPLVAINFIGLFSSEFPLNASIARNALAFHFPVGVLIGSIIYARSSATLFDTPGEPLLRSAARANLRKARGGWPAWRKYRDPECPWPSYPSLAPTTGDPRSPRCAFLATPVRPARVGDPLLPGKEGLLANYPTAAWRESL